MSDELADFHPQAFTRANNEPDTIFYAQRGQQTLMDVGARTAVTALYQTSLPATGDICDLMCGALSHIPPGVSHASVTGIDVSLHALEANTALTNRVVQDLNSDRKLPFEDDTLDAITLCDGFAYLTAPLTIFQEIQRVLKPGAPVLLTFSDHFHPAKATALWQALDPADRVRLISVVMTRSGFKDIDTGEVMPPEDVDSWNDAVHAVIARKGFES